MKSYSEIVVTVIVILAVVYGVLTIGGKEFNQSHVRMDALAWYEAITK